MKEIWKDIKGYEGLYQVSNFGRVKSIPRNGTILKERILQPKISKQGYYEVNLNNKYKRKMMKVHRLVAEAFIFNYNNLPFVNHKDFNTLNNNVKNLEWVTPKENTLYSKKLGRYNNSYKLKMKRVNQYNKQGELIKTWNSITEASKMLNIDKGHISACCKHKKNYNTSGGYRWEYAE